jgi:hypothetical protein
MDEEENDRKDKKNMNERGCRVEGEECLNPREEQNKREGKKHKSHELSRFIH